MVLFFSYLSIQQRHRDIAIDVASPRAQSGELYGGGRWEGRRQRGRLGGELEFIAAAEMPHLGSCSSVAASQRQGHLVVVRDLCGQGNLWWEYITFCLLSFHPKYYIQASIKPHEFLIQPLVRFNFQIFIPRIVKTSKGVFSDWP